MKVRIIEDERYPDYDVEEAAPDDEREPLFEMSKEDYEEYMGVCDQYNEWQNKIRLLNRAKP